MLRLIFQILIPLAIALSGGTASALYAIENFQGFSSFTVGPWTAQPAVGTNASDPYVRAQVARDSKIPLGQAEGLAYVAIRDSDGELLSLQCTYRIEGELPAARLWTIRAGNEEGMAVTHPARNISALHSRQLVRSSDGRVAISASPVPQTGNWLGISGVGNFRIVLTLYDSQSANRSNIAPVSMPQIHRNSCV